MHFPEIVLKLHLLVPRCHGDVQGDRRSAAGARPSQPGQAPQALSQTAGQGQYAGVSTAAQAPAPSAAAATQRQSSAGAGAGAGAGPHTSSHTSAPQQPLVPHPPEKRDTQERSFQRVSQGGGAGAGRTSQTGGAERVSHTGGGERVSHTGGADRASHSSNSDRVSASSRVPAASQSGEGNARSASQVAEGKAPSSQSSEGKVPSSQAARAAPTSQASTDARKAQGQGQEQAKEQAKEQQKGQQQGQGQAAPRSSPGADAGAREFFTEYGEANRYTILEVIGKGSYVSGLWGGGGGCWEKQASGRGRHVMGQEPGQKAGGSPSARLLAQRLCERCMGEAGRGVRWWGRNTTRCTCFTSTLCFIQPYMHAPTCPPCCSQGIVCSARDNFTGEKVRGAM